MYIVVLQRQGKVLPHTYGRVFFDGKEVTYEGLTCIFQFELTKGTQGKGSNLYVPQDGLEFLKNLKYHFNRGDLSATNVLECK